ncbi:TetR family transcriptional regulator [Actinocorallia sp. A-T 12471]|uniref:TetR family transcriptional regulator n=1 Tax=Actinocorallia sp. A-T 12471 TaxID=3089813 RepID=UPI0029CCFEB4|nr:TetR family transcriptional regulator [Actinocorallia sp. A-T 12471]MDX6744432.1 TetR family transcriptional regulator [Actinocorallia sp. A-T 12471]
MTGAVGQKPRKGRQDRRIQTRKALLDAAQRLFAERGIHVAALDDVAHTAGLTKGAVYSNFAGKPDLVIALMERCASHAPRLHGRWVDASEDDRLLAQLLVEFWLYGMRDGAAGWRLAEWAEEQRREIARRITPEDAADADAEAAASRATHAMAMEMGLALQHLLDPDRVPAEVYRSGMDLVLKGGTTPTR